MNGIEFVFNNQNVLILLLLVKAVCGIDFMSFNNTLQYMQIPLIVCSPGIKMSHGTSHGRLTDVVLVSRVCVCVSGLHSQFML